MVSTQLRTVVKYDWTKYCISHDFGGCSLDNCYTNVKNEQLVVYSKMDVGFKSVISYKQSIKCTYISRHMHMYLFDMISYCHFISCNYHYCILRPVKLQCG